MGQNVEWKPCRLGQNMKDNVNWEKMLKSKKNEPVCRL
jgi:hypothetical protein